MAQTYDINRFLREVQALLWQAGLDPKRAPDQPKPHVAAGMLLRAYGIMPVIDQVDTLARAMGSPWTERDESNRGEGSEESNETHLDKSI